MFRQGCWIAVAGAVVAIVALVVLANRGPASGRAPAGSSDSGAEAPGRGAAQAGSVGATVSVSVAVLPAGAAPAWRLELRDGMGAVHTAEGSGERVVSLAGVALGKAMFRLGAQGFLGETRRLVVEGTAVSVSATLRGFGRVTGRLHCDGLPVGGALVQLAPPPETLSLEDLEPGDRMPGGAWSAESDGEGRYRFDRVPPGEGFTLVAADFDHVPSRAGPVAVRPDEETVVDIKMIRGAHLAGRIVDSRGAPCAGVTVHLFQKQQRRGVVGWLDEARARTDDDGRFVSPALAGTEIRMIKAWIAAEGVQQIVQHETAPPERGTKDVGTLAPLPGTIVFEAEAVEGIASFSITAMVGGIPPAGQAVLLSGVAFDAEGRARIGGFPVGDGVYTVLDHEQRAVAQGTFRTTGRDMVVKIGAFGEPPQQPPEPAERLVIDLGGTLEDTTVVLLSDGKIVRSRRVPKGHREPVVEPLSPGRYTLYVGAGDRYAQREVTQVEGADLNVSIVPERVGRTVVLLVLLDGTPVPGARVAVRGFLAGSRGQGVPWAEAGEDGRAVLRGIPEDVSALTLVVLDREGAGRTYSLEIDATAELRVDLAKAPAEDR